MNCAVLIKILPAIHAVMKQATFPAIIARITTRDRSLFRLGAMAPSAPSMIPIEPMLENPQRAYVERTTERCWKYFENSTEDHEVQKLVKYCRSIYNIYNIAMQHFFSKEYLMSMLYWTSDCNKLQILTFLYISFPQSILTMFVNIRTYHSSLQMPLKKTSNRHPSLWYINLQNWCVGETLCRREQISLCMY